MKKLLLVILLASPAVAQVPCNVVDLQAAITAAKPGDVLTVAAGASRATTPVTIGKAVEIRFDPACSITDDYTGGDLFTLTDSSARITGGRFLTGLGPVNSTPFHFVRATGFFVWTDSTFELAYGSNAFGVRTNQGVIARNRFTGQLGGGNCSNNASSLRLKPISSGDVWNRPYQWGGLDALFFEDNTLTNLFEGVDIDDNGTAAVRRNTFTNSAFIHHGIDTGYDGARTSELYGNDFVSDLAPACGDLPPGTNSMIYIRGGSTRIFDNKIADVRSPTWGDKSEVTITAEELRRYSGRTPCATVYPSFHQSGWGYLIGAVPVLGQAQDLEPIHIWGNTGAGNYANPSIHDYSPNECGPGAPSAADFIKIGREIILAAPPNYSPAPYPHPAVNAGSPPPGAPVNLRLVSIK